MTCPFCNAGLPMTGKPGFRDRCPACDKPLHCCRNCRFYDASLYNQCREPRAERVVEKERENRCDWFETAPPGRGGSGSQDDPRKKFDSLFGG
jgi:hypothetical protein